MANAKVWMEKTVIPTYAAGKPDRNPVFLEHRVYQGASGRIYPHTVIESVSDNCEDREYTALYLENEYLKIMVLPEIGGRVQRAIDKTNGYDFVYYNHVIKPAMVGLAGPWISGGIEFNWPQHHRPSTFDPVQWSLEENADGSASIIVGETENMYRTRSVTRMTLYPGKAYLELQNQVFNGTNQPQTFLWWANPAVPVNEHTRSIFPPDVHAVMDHGKRDVSAFPIARGVYYKMDYSRGVDISRYRNIPVPTSYMAAHSDYDFLGNYDDARKAGMLHIADHHISPGKKQWTWGCGEFGQAWDRNLTDNDGPYIELMTGCFTDNQPDFSWIMPQEEKRFTQYFMPYKEVGAVGNATREAVAGIEHTEDSAIVRVYTTAAYSGARVTVYQDGKALREECADIAPDRPYTLAIDTAAELLEVEVRDASGRTLVRYAEKAAADEELPKPAGAIEPAAEVESADKLYTYALHLEQYHHATWDAADYLLEGLKRDPDDVRMNNAYGKLLMKRGLVAESIPFFKKAVGSATEKNPNPYDGEFSFNLGVSLELNGETDAAYEAYFKACWNGAWQGAAYYNVARIDMQRGEYDRAETHLNEALRHEAGNVKALNALAALMRVTGRNAQAYDVAVRALAIDPLNPVAQRELSLCMGTAECWSEKLGADPNPYIEMALEYQGLGLKGDAAAVLNEALKHTDYPLLNWHLAHMTGDDAALERAETADQAGCFPHRPEDCIALEYAIRHIENAGMAHNALGCYWYDKRAYDRAIEHWQAATRLAPDFPTAHRNLALAYYNKSNNPQAAKRELELAFALDKTDARVFMELDQLYQKLHMPVAQRFKQLSEHSELVDMRDDLKLSYATVLNSLGRYEDALEFIMARRFHPWEGGEGKVPAQWRMALIMLARKAMDAGDYDAALEKLYAAAGPYPENLGEGRLPSAMENDAWYWIGCCLEKCGRDTEARDAFIKATKGDTEPAGMLYYNDQPPEGVFYHALALEKLGQSAQAAEVFWKLRNYAAKHRDDTVITEYFAVSLPELAIFDEDLNVRNRVHCLLMDALGALGQRNVDEAAALLGELDGLSPENQGAYVHGTSLMNRFSMNGKV